MTTAPRPPRRTGAVTAVPTRSEPLIRLDRFTSAGLQRGRPVGVEVAWLLVKRVFFASSLPWPAPLKAALLRGFGARVGVGLYLRPRVNIHFPWKLELGDHCWIGEGCEILNLEPFTMGDHSALAHFVYVAAAGHDVHSPTMAYANAPVHIGTGAWIGTRAFLGAGTRIGDYAVVAAGAVVVKDVPDRAVVAGVPATFVKERTIRPAPDPGAGAGCSSPHPHPSAKVPHD
jgi:putative colanic acid biosynthesis acetyltransferase WcaF